MPQQTAAACLSKTAHWLPCTSVCSLLKQPCVFRLLFKFSIKGPSFSFLLVFSYCRTVSAIQQSSYYRPQLSRHAHAKPTPAQALMTTGPLSGMPAQVARRPYAAQSTPWPPCISRQLGEGRMESFNLKLFCHLGLQAKTPDSFDSIWVHKFSWREFLHMETVQVVFTFWNGVVTVELQRKHHCGHHCPFSQACLG